MSLIIDNETHCFLQLLLRNPFLEDDNFDRSKYVLSSAKPEPINYFQEFGAGSLCVHRRGLGWVLNPSLTGTGWRPSPSAWIRGSYTIKVRILIRLTHPFERYKREIFDKLETSVIIECCGSDSIFLST